jgi:hypothetical protein
MSQGVVGQRPVSRDGGRARAARVGGVVAIVTMALVVYGAYGAAKASASQKSGVPFEIIIVAVVAVVVYGLLAPLALRAVESGRAAGRNSAVALAVVSVLSLAMFWSGLPLILGGAAALVAMAGRERIGGSKVFSAAWALGLLAAGASIAVTILGNTIVGH